MRNQKPRSPWVSEKSACRHQQYIRAWSTDHAGLTLPLRRHHIRRSEYFVHATLLLGVRYLYNMNFHSRWWYLTLREMEGVLRWRHRQDFLPWPWSWFFVVVRETPRDLRGRNTESGSDYSFLWIPLSLLLCDYRPPPSSHERRYFEQDWLTWQRARS